MRRPVIALSVAAGLLCAAGVSAAASLPVPVPVTVPSTPVTAPFASPNVTHVGTIPLEGVGVSMDTKTLKDGRTIAYVTGAAGLSTYDATDPTAPELLGHLPIYNFENEDIAVSADGTKTFLTEFTANGYLHAVDVSDPALPLITDTIVGQGPHTVVCANAACDYLYGSNGEIFDVRDMSDIKLTDLNWATMVGATGSIHNVHQDEAGVWISDTTPLTVFEQVKGDPLKLRKLGTGGVNNAGYQHNNIRVDADRYKKRDASAAGAGGIRPGELLLGNGETNFTGTCGEDAGSFSTWTMAGFDQGVKMKQVDILRPVDGTYDNGDPAVQAMGCSAHWFTEKDAADGASSLVAGAWYEHGTRFLKVDKSTGKISQVGFFQPVRGAASEAFWMPTKDGSDVAWTIDYRSGIDILTFSQDPKLVPTKAAVNQSWLVKKGVVDPFADALRSLCKAGGDLAMDADLPGYVAEHHAVAQVAKATFRDLAALPR